MSGAANCHRQSECSDQERATSNETLHDETFPQGDLSRRITALPSTPKPIPYRRCDAYATL